MSISMIGIDHSMAPVEMAVLFFLHAIAWRYGQVWMMRQSFLYIKSFVN